MQKKSELKQQQQYQIYKQNFKSHNDQIICIQSQNENNNIIASSSADKSIRIWDLRLNSSVKMYKNKEIVDLQNILFDKNDQIYVSNSVNIQCYDLRSEKIIEKSVTKYQLLNNQVKQESKKGQEDINQIQFTKDENQIVGIDDGGNISMYDKQTLDLLQEYFGGHSNIGYTIEVIEQGENEMAISGGFDSKVVYWDLNSKKIIQSVNLVELSQKFISGQLLSPPLIYSICNQHNLSIVSTETGHIFGLNAKQPKKPKFIIDAHLGKVIRSVFAKFNPQIIVSVSNDLSFALWDLKNRDQYHNPIFLKRIAIDAKPNWITTNSNHQIFVATVNPEFSIYTIKN